MLTFQIRGNLLNGNPEPSLEKGRCRDCNVPRSFMLKDVENRDSVSYKRSLLIGMLLGKSNSKILLNNEQPRAEFTVEHSLTQNDLLVWKAKEVERLLKVKVTFFSQTLQGKEGFSFIASRRVRIIHKWFHHGNRKVITPKIRFMDHPVGLAMLLCDTATVQGNVQDFEILNPFVDMSLNAFTESELKLFTHHLKATMNIEAILEFDTKNGWIHFDATNSKLMWKVVKHWLPPVESIQNKFHALIDKDGT